jgi:hypothetical protein
VDVTIHCGITGVGNTTGIPFQKGIKTGSREAGELYNILVEYGMEFLIDSWGRRDFGFRVPEMSRPINHLWWVDNCFLFSKSFDELSIMVYEVSMVLWSQLKWKWKPTSLNILTVNSSLGQEDIVTDMPPEYCTSSLLFKVVGTLTVLGTQISNQDHESVYVEHRLAKGTGCFYANLKLLMADAPLVNRLQAFASNPRACARFALGLTHLNGRILHQLRTWELTHLRKQFRLRRKPGEAHHMYMTRSALRVRTWMQDSGVATFPEIVLESVFRAAMKSFQRRSIAHELRSSRSLLWWEGVKTWSSQERKKEMCLRNHQGPHHDHEDPFVVAWGIEWRAVVFREMTKTELKNLENYFVEANCNRHFIKMTGSRKKERDQEEEHPAKMRKCDDMLSEPCPEFISCIADRIWANNLAAIQIEVVADCQPLVNALLGWNYLERPSESVTMNLTNASDAMANRVSTGEWVPRAGYLQPFRWVKRSRNKIADYLANQGLAGVERLQENDGAIRFLRGRRPLGIQAFTDGGHIARSNTSAIGVHIVAYYLAESSVWICVDVARLSCTVPSEMSSNSFEAEAYGLATAVQTIININL